MCKLEFRWMIFQDTKRAYRKHCEEEIFDVDNDDDTSFSTRGLCTRPNPSQGLRQFQNDLYITQREFHLL